MAWRPTKKASGLVTSTARAGSAQTQHQGYSPSGQGIAGGSPSLPGTPLSNKRAPTRPPLPLPPPSLTPIGFTATTSKHLLASSSPSFHLSRGHLVRSRSRERPLPSPAGICFLYPLSFQNYEVALGLLPPVR